MSEEGPTLLILAAGLGSRFGGVKQVESFGRNSQTIMDYSIYDAIKAGFKKIVLVISKEIETHIQQSTLKRFADRVKLDYVFQELDNLPTGYSCPLERKKPWGTGHAILVARDIVETPFAVINADDFYGAEAFKSMKTALEKTPINSNDFCMIGYRLINTLSKFGGVSRGLCRNKNGFLDSITEISGLEEKSEQIQGYQGDELKTFDPESIVSMNFWGFSVKIFSILEDRFKQFLSKSLDVIQTEFFITEVLDFAIKKELIKIKVLTTDEKWFGVTYRDDAENVKNRLASYTNSGIYPDSL